MFYFFDRKSENLSRGEFFDAVKMQNYIIFIFLWLRSVTAPFYWGSAPFSENEMPELNGRMTPREVNIFFLFYF
jgi:hypothetical protein